MRPRVELRQIAFSYGKWPILSGVSFAIRANEFVAVIGPNGSGKTTLLQVMFGMRLPQSGEVLLDGVSIQNLSRKALAREITFLPQETSIEFEFSVREVVAMGRNPHLGRFQSETPKCRLVIERALSMTDVLHLADRPITALSGGERQRALLARSIAQETFLLLLDEPTANLDMGHQIETLALARNLVGQGRSVVAAIHDLNLASRYADRVILLSHGKIMADGLPQDVITAESLACYFHIRAHIQPQQHLEQGLIVTPMESLRTNTTSTEKCSKL